MSDMVVIRWDQCLSLDDDRVNRAAASDIDFAFGPTVIRGHHFVSQPNMGTTFLPSFVF